MSNWNPSELESITDDELFDLVDRELVHVVRRPRVSTNDAVRVVRNAGLTNQLPSRWTRW